MRTPIRVHSLVLCAAAFACTGEKRVPLPRYTEQEYQLGREDVIEIIVQGDAGLSRTLPIRPDGRITLPLCGEITLAGMTARQAAAEIAERLEVWVKDPRVTVVVREVNAARVYVFGEVHRAGAFPLRSSATVFTALAAAGGLTEWAHAGRILVVRVHADGSVERIRLDLDDALDGSEDATFQLVPGDTVYVP